VDGVGGGDGGGGGNGVLGRVSSHRANVKVKRHGRKERE
jgi:hypothetical protein